MDSPGIAHGQPMDSPWISMDIHGWPMDTHVIGGEILWKSFLGRPQVFFALCLTFLHCVYHLLCWSGIDSRYMRNHVSMFLEYSGTPSCHEGVGVAGHDKCRGNAFANRFPACRRTFPKAQPSIVVYGSSPWQNERRDNVGHLDMTSE